MAHDFLQKAKDLGFASEKEMFQQLYTTQSIGTLAKSLGISVHLLRKKLNENNVDLRHRGGPNNVKVTMNAEVVEEMKVKGAKAVALAQGVSPYTLFKQKRKFLDAKQPTTGEDQQSEPPPAGTESLDPSGE